MTKLTCVRCVFLEAEFPHPGHLKLDTKSESDSFFFLIRFFDFISAEIPEIKGGQGASFPLHACFQTKSHKVHF
jgi:hypothetical protein